MYYTIAKAIEYVERNTHRQPSLAEIAEAVGASPTHLQRTFTQWTGISPKRMLQYLTLEFLKKGLRDSNITPFSAFDEAGMKAPARAYELFVRLEGMTPTEYRKGGEGLSISYSLHDSIYGKVFIAHTDKGLCRLTFIEDKLGKNGNTSNERISENLHKELFSIFPNAYWVEKPHLQNRAIIDALENPLKLNEPLYLHVKATPFQLKVWEALLKLSPDRWTSYGQIAEDINYDKKACRAVGTAVGANPIAIIIPCHRVLRADGGIGGYFWGTTKKKAILMREYGLGDMAN